VLVGCAIGAVASADSAAAFPWGVAGVVALAASLLYVGGMILNDVVDARIDTEERSTRPIPSGRVSRRAAGGVAVVLFVAGAAIPAFFGVAPFVAAVVLVGSIVAYDLWHKRWAGVVIFMGACRGLAPAFGAVAVLAGAGADAFIAALGYWPMPLSLAVYTVLLTVVARHEASPRAQSGGWSVVALPFVTLPVGIVVPPESWVWPIPLGLGLIAWLVVASRALAASPPCVPVAVGAMIAGMSIVDAYFLSLLGRPVPVLIALGCFVLTVAGQRRIAGS